MEYRPAIYRTAALTCGLDLRAPLPELITEFFLLNWGTPRFTWVSPDL
jgi:hypothetical protein